MEFLFVSSFIISFIIVAILLFYFILCLRKDDEPSSKKPTQQVVLEYDSEGYNRQGYNEAGRNRQGKYNRFYNVKCYKTGLYSEEGFLDIRKNPIYLTNHATIEDRTFGSPKLKK